MTLDDLLAQLEPLQQQVVALVYFEGRTQEETARLLTVERVVVAAALAVSFRTIARWVMDEDLELTSFGATRLARHRRADSR